MIQTKQISIISASIIISLIMVINLFDGSNSVGNLFGMLLPLAALIGLIAPKKSLFILIFLSIYIDIGKKILTLGENLLFNDLFLILGIPPVLNLGIFISCLLTFCQSHSKKPIMIRVLLFTIALAAFFSIYTIGTKGVNTSTIKYIANNASYLTLCFSLPYLIKNQKEIFKLIQYALIFLIPAILHTLYHVHVGLFDFEWDYILSGFTSVDLYALSGEGIFGPFSSQGALAGTMTFFATLCLFFGYLYSKNQRSTKKTIQYTAYFIAFLYIAIISLKRGPILILPVCLAIYIGLKREAIFLTIFSIFMILLTTVILNSEYLINKLPEWQAVIYNSMASDNKDLSFLTKIRTLKIRLEELHTLTLPETWSLFGNAQLANSVSNVHVGFVNIIWKIGAVPFFIALTSVIFIALKVIRFLRNIPNPLVNFYIALGMSVLIVPQLGFGSSSAFPLPVWVGLSWGLAVTYIKLHYQRVAVYPQLATER